MLRKYCHAKPRHGALRIFRRHLPDGLGTGGYWVMQQERAGQHLKKSHGSSRPTRHTLQRTGPSSGFTPGPLDVNVDRGRADTQASTEPKADPTIAEPKVEPTITVHKTRVVRAEKPRVPVRTRLARRHSSPLDAQAFDT